MIAVPLWILYIPTMMECSSRIRLGSSCPELVLEVFWPPLSLDINPIEHLQDMVEKLIRTEYLIPTNSAKLWAAIQTAWLNTN